MLKEHGGENVSLIQRRLNWFSWGRYDKHNWHLTVRQVNGKPSQADKVRFHQIEGHARGDHCRPQTVRTR